MPGSAWLSGKRTRLVLLFAGTLAVTATAAISSLRWNPGVMILIVRNDETFSVRAQVEMAKERHSEQIAAGGDYSAVRLLTTEGSVGVNAPPGCNTRYFPEGGVAVHLCTFKQGTCVQHSLRGPPSALALTLIASLAALTWTAAKRLLRSMRSSP